MQQAMSMDAPKQVYDLRDYQKDSVRSGITFFNRKTGPNEIQVLPTGSGKSLCIAGIVNGTIEPMLILQPSKEILAQNYEKFISFGGHASIFSASIGRKEIGDTTYASLPSIMAKDAEGRQKSLKYFTHFRNIIVDECHLATSAQAGQFKDFLAALHNPRVLGMTATPFRLASYNGRNGKKDSMLKFLTRTSPKIFGKVGYSIDISELSQIGFLAKLKYYPQRKVLDHLFDRNAIAVNSTGADFKEESLREYYQTIDFNNDVISVVKRVNKAGRRCLAFVSFVEDALWISSQLGPRSATVHGATPIPIRAEIERRFKNGELDSVINVGCWTVGFDDPYLSCVVIAKPMRSLALYYQMLGRGMRKPSDKPDKDCWCIDLCGNMETFGRVEDLKMGEDKKGLPLIYGSGNKVLTGVPLSQSINLEEFVGDSFG